MTSDAARRLRSMRRRHTLLHHVPTQRPVPELHGESLHRIIRTSFDRRHLGALLASDYGHLPLRELAESDVHLPGEGQGHMAAVVASIREHGVLEPLLVRVGSNGEQVLLDGHHRAVAVLREHLAERVPVLVVQCPCTMGCAVIARELRRLHEHAVADGWE